MIEQIRKFDKNIMAFEAIESFTKADVQIAHKLFEKKLSEGFPHIDVLVKLDELKIGKVETKAFFEDVLWILRNIESIGNIAIVAHSNILKALVPLDDFFFERLKKGFQERYFDVSQLDEAFYFIESNNIQ